MLKYIWLFPVILLSAIIPLLAFYPTDKEMQDKAFSNHRTIFYSSDKIPSLESASLSFDNKQISRDLQGISEFISKAPRTKYEYHFGVSKILKIWPLNCQTHTHTGMNGAPQNTYAEIIKAASFDKSDTVYYKEVWLLIDEKWQVAESICVNTQGIPLFTPAFLK